MNFFTVFYAGSVNFDLLLSFLLVFALPIVITICIARFRGVFAALFFLPTLYGGVYLLDSKIDFIASLSSNSSTLLQAIGYLCTIAVDIHLLFHYSIINPIIQILNVESGPTFDVLTSEYLAVIPYCILFIILYIFVHIRKPKAVD
ncbi:MAG: hypothetical protein ACI4U5_00685 [Bacilli bacterium]